MKPVISIYKKYYKPLVFGHGLLLFLLGGFCEPVRGQQQREINITKFSQQQGLPAYNIRSIYKDKLGFIWIATQSGAYNYDGVRFKAYTRNTAKPHQLSGIDIRGFAATAAGAKVWLLPGEIGMNEVNINSQCIEASVNFPSMLPNEWNLCICPVGKSLWVGSVNKIRVYNTQNRNFENGPVLPAAINGSLTEVSAIEAVSDNNGTVWTAVNGYGIAVYHSGSRQPLAVLPFTELGIPANNRTFKINSLCPISDTGMLIGTTDGLFLVTQKGNDISKAALPDKQLTQFNHTNIDYIKKDGKGNIYFATAAGLYFFDQSQHTLIHLVEKRRDDESDWLGAVLTIFCDDDGIVWLGCKQGLARFRTEAPRFRAYFFDSKSKQKLEHVHAVFASSNHIYAGLREGAVQIDKNTGQFTPIGKGSLYRDIFKDADSSLVLSNQKGVFTCENGQLRNIGNRYSEWKMFEGFPVNSHVFAGDSLLILGTENENGILVWNYRRHSLRNISHNSKGPQLAAAIVNKVYRDTKGNIWVLSDNNITVLNSSLNQARHLTYQEDSTKMPLGLYFGMTEAGGYYWIGSYGYGLLQADSSLNIVRHYDVAAGLSDEGVYEVFGIGDSAVYVTSNNGLSILDLKKKTFRRFYQSDGLHSNAFEEACGYMQDNIIYAGGVNGFSVIDPAKISPNNTPPSLFFSQITIETASEKTDTTNVDLQQLTVPSGVLQTTIYLSGINWINPERVSYVWRILENDKKWATLNTNNKIVLIGLTHGTYHLQVKAANEDGVWSEPKELILVFLPKWYQTWWFYLLIALAVAGLLYALYRYRIAQIKKQHEIRKNIATDLHDDLGSTLNSVKVFTNLAISGIKQEESLQQVKENLTEATMSLRDMIWVLDDSLDTVDELVTRLKQFALPVTAASNIEFTIHADSDVNNRQLTKEEKRNLFLICKEAVNNSIKYSGGTQINIGISPAGKKIQITIQDNGRGFDEATVKKGYGLKNMQYRAGQVNYAVEVKSQLQEGTSITVLPA